MIAQVMVYANLDLCVNAFLDMDKMIVQRSLVDVEIKIVLLMKMVESVSENQKLKAFVNVRIIVLDNFVSMIMIPLRLIAISQSTLRKYLYKVTPYSI